MLQTYLFCTFKSLFESEVFNIEFSVWKSQLEFSVRILSLEFPVIGGKNYIWGYHCLL